MDFSTPDFQRIQNIIFTMQLRFSKFFVPKIKIKESTDYTQEESSVNFTLSFHGHCVQMQNLKSNFFLS